MANVKLSSKELPISSFADTMKSRGAFSFSWSFGKSAVMAKIPAEFGQRNEDFARIRNNVSVTVVPELSGKFRQFLRVRNFG